MIIYLKIKVPVFKISKAFLSIGNQKLYSGIRGTFNKKFNSFKFSAIKPVFVSYFGGSVGACVLLWYCLVVCIVGKIDVVLVVVCILCLVLCLSLVLLVFVTTFVISCMNNVYFL